MPGERETKLLNVRLRKNGRPVTRREYDRRGRKMGRTAGNEIPERRHRPAVLNLLH
jgi:hypothetical protein